jgi:proteic killer suppression protein
MITTFRHKGLEAFFLTGSKAGIQPAHAARLQLQLQLTALNAATSPEEMNVPGWRLHPLKGRDLKGHWSVWVNGNWRMTFRFSGVNAELVDYQDYH